MLIFAKYYSNASVMLAVFFKTILNYFN